MLSDGPRNIILNECWVYKFTLILHQLLNARPLLWHVLVSLKQEVHQFHTSKSVYRYHGIFEKSFLWLKVELCKNWEIASSDFSVGWFWRLQVWKIYIYCIYMGVERKKELTWPLQLTPHLCFRLQLEATLVATSMTHLNSKTGGGQSSWSYCLLG